MDVLLLPREEGEGSALIVVVVVGGRGDGGA
jgi:hypothetical protein